MATTFNKTEAIPPPRQIRFVHNQGQPPSKRRRINAACLTCRRRKTRCAGERPLCSTCTKNGHQCLGYPEDHKKEANDAGDGKASDDDQPADDKDHDEEQDRNTKKLQAGLTAAGHGSTSPERTRQSQPSRSGIARDAESNGVEAKPSPSRTSHATQSQAVYSDSPGSPTLRRGHSNRVPYFRYFGPTAIVPGFKQMVVSVRDRRRSTGGSNAGTSPMSHATPGLVGRTASTAENEAVIDELATYDPHDPAPVHPLILGLVKTFFLHLGCNYVFLKERKFLRMVKEKRVEPILVDAVCALAARFSDSPVLTGGNEKMLRSERGNVFAQRAKQATVDTFPAPSVGAVQACLLMAYEGFGANQDSALWMYLGLAIRMAIDLGLQKRVGIQYQGEKDPWFTTQRGRKSEDNSSPEEKKAEPDSLTLEEQKEVEQERIDTFFCVFLLDRFISSGTGRPVTLREDDFELPFPDPALDAATEWPSPLSIFLEIMQLAGRVSDVLNNIRGVHDLTQDKWEKLRKLENRLTKLYKSWDARLQFNVTNFKAHLGAGQGTTFLLLHLWFHALFIILHQPTLMTPFGDLRSDLQLLSDSRELSMSSAKTICDILAFADLIDPGSFIGNPFTSQPIYIAACAFLMESSANASEAPSREGSPPRVGLILDQVQANKIANSKHSRHSLLASAANQNYQRCYNSLQQMHIYWGGVKYILTALDQKSKGIWDCETYTTDEYESTKGPRRQSLNGQFRLDGQVSPKLTGPPIAWSLAGTANSPNSSLTLMYQNPLGNPGGLAAQGMPRQATTPPGNMVYDPIRQSLPESPNIYVPSMPQPNTSAVRNSPRPPPPRQLSDLSGGGALNYDPIDTSKMYLPTGFTPPSTAQSNGFDGSGFGASPNGSTLADGNGRGGALPSSAFYPPTNNTAYRAPWGLGNMDAITFDSQDIDLGALGLQQTELMGPWLDYLPGDVLGLFGEQDIGGQQGQP